MKKTILTLALIASTSAFADVKGGKIGMDFSYANAYTTVGVRWHIIDMLAIRPTIGYSSGTATTTTTAPVTSSEVKTTNLLFGLAVPIYLAKFNLLDMYVAPSFDYTSTNLKTTTAAGTTEATGSSLGFSALLGLQVALNDQIHAFGEVGFGYTSTETKSGTTNVTTVTNNNLGTARYALGAIFYFN